MIRQLDNLQENNHFHFLITTIFQVMSFFILFFYFIFTFTIQNEKAFTDEEEEKLQAAFQLTSRDVDNILDTISFVLEQAAYHSARPNSLNKQLSAIGFTEEKVLFFPSRKH